MTTKTMITRKEAEIDENLYPLMNFMIAWGRDIKTGNILKNLVVILVKKKYYLEDLIVMKCFTKQLDVHHGQLT